MAILQETLINGNIRTRDTTFNTRTTPPRNFDDMGGTKIIADNIGATRPTETYYCSGNLFLGSVGTTLISDNIEEVTESSLYYLGGIQVNVNTADLSLIPSNYNYQTKQRNYSFRTNLGINSAPWMYLHLGELRDSSTGSYYSSYLRGTSSGIQISLPIQSTTSFSVYPSRNSTSSTTGFNLGSSSYKWRYLYAYGGTIQTSDRAAKDSIHYLEEQPAIAKMSTKSTTTSTTGITMDDVIDFVKNIKPTTFCYYDGEETATEENSDQEMIQLGLIADDIKDHKLYKYIGVDRDDTMVIEEEKDEEGNVIQEHEEKPIHTLGLQVLPLTVAALTACKNLLGRVEQLEQQIKTQ